jgi:hypothetical protein
MSLHDGSRWTARELRTRTITAYVLHSEDFTIYEWVAWNLLDSYANGAPECWPSQATLVNAAPWVKSTALEALASLEERGLIERIRGGGERGPGGTTTRYKLHDPQDCDSSNVGRSPRGRPPDGLEVLGSTTNLRAEQQEVGPKEETPLVSATRTSATRSTNVGSAASREANPDPKPVRRVTTELTKSPSGKVKRRRARASTSEEVVTAPDAPRFTDAGPGGPRKSASERRSERMAAARAAARRGAEDATRAREEGK